MAHFMLRQVITGKAPVSVPRGFVRQEGLKLEKWAVTQTFAGSGSDATTILFKEKPDPRVGVVIP